MSRLVHRLRTATSLAVVALMSVGATQPKARVNAPHDIAAIELIEDQLATETNMDRLIGYYAPNATVLDIYAPGLYRGRAEIHAGFAKQMAGIKSMTSKILEMNVASDGNFACAASQVHFDLVMGDGKPLAVTVRQLDAFKRIGKDWKIVQQHISLPVDPATSQALLDSPAPVGAKIAWAKNPFPGPASSPAAAKSAIRKWMEVGGASTSIDMMMGYYGPGDDILVYDMGPTTLRGLAQVRDHYTAVMGTFTDPKIEMPLFVVDSDGLFGVQIDTQHLSIKLNDGSTTRLALRQSDCMRKSGGRWYSFMEHLSFVVDPTTGKAIDRY
jgi:ketosteroid isomerase-like protein